MISCFSSHSCQSGLICSRFKATLSSEVIFPMPTSDQHSTVGVHWMSTKLWVRALLASLLITAALIWAGIQIADMALWSPGILNSGRTVVFSPHLFYGTQSDTLTSWPPNPWPPNTTLMCTNTSSYGLVPLNHFSINSCLTQYGFVSVCVICVF